MRKAIAVAATCLSFVSPVAVCTAHAATYDALYYFKYGTDAARPSGNLIYEAGTLYGVSSQGGTANKGTVYSVNAVTGAEKILYNFKGGADGSNPAGTLLFHGGLLFGTTTQGGAHGAGTVFVVNPLNDNERVLYGFAGKPDGATPVAGLINLNGTLYGTTELGGSYGGGTIYAVAPKTGAVQVVYSFGSPQADNDGNQPESGLTAQNGIIYGTTFSGGSGYNGTVFKFNPANEAEAVLHSFTGKSDGANPAAGLIYRNGLLYGTTSCTQGYCPGIYGTVFSVDPATGAEIVLNAFSNTGDGATPLAGLTYFGGAVIGVTSGIVNSTDQCCSTIFATPTQYMGAVTLYTFPNGINSSTGLTFYNGAFYGTTDYGVFKFTL